MINPRLGDDPKAFHRLLHPTGEWAARFLIIGMMASGLILLFKRKSWPRRLLHHRRDIAVAAYPAAVLVLFRWAAMKDWGSWPPALIHFGPLIALWAYRGWYWYLRDRPAAAT
jgi:hypothetical protein